MKKIFLLFLIMIIALPVVSEEAVIVVFPLGDQVETDLSEIFKLEEKLAKAISGSKSGELDGNEVGQGEAVLYMYGPDADMLYRVIKPVLDSAVIIESGFVRVRYGPPGAKEVRFLIGESS